MSIISDAIDKAISNLDNNVTLIEVEILATTMEEGEHLCRDYILNDKVISQWYDFVGTVDSIINSFGNLTNVSYAESKEKLIEYLNFISFSNDEYIIKISLSNCNINRHSRNKIRTTTNIVDFNLLSIRVNNVHCKSYNNALHKIRALLADDLMNR